MRPIVELRRADVNRAARRFFTLMGGDAKSAAAKQGIQMLAYQIEGLTFDRRGMEHDGAFEADARRLRLTLGHEPDGTLFVELCGERHAIGRVFTVGDEIVAKLQRP